MRAGGVNHPKVRTGYRIIVCVLVNACVWVLFIRVGRQFSLCSEAS